MCFWQSCKTWFKNNKEDIFAVFVMSFIIIAILSSYTFNTLAPQEGWYSIYARNILQDGLVPYKDFFLVVPPIFLYICTAWQAIFGDNFIVFHYLNFIFQIVCAISLYYLFKQIFNRQIAFFTGIFITVFKMLSRYDNGVSSYNTLSIVFMALLTLFTIKQVDFIDTYKKISKKWLWFTGCIFAFSFLNKQTNGALTIIASCLVLTTVTYKVLGFKQTISHFLKLFIISMLFVFVLLFPLLINGALPFMADSLFNATSKGSIIALLMKFLLLPCPFYYWPFYLTVFIVFFVVLFKGYKFVYDQKMIKFSNYLINFVLIFLAIFLLCLKNVFPNLDESWILIAFPVGFFSCILILCYLLYKGIWTKKRVSLIVILIAFFFSSLADSMSHSLFYPQFFILLTGILLSWKWNKYNKIKNAVLFLFSACLFIQIFVVKLNLPMSFWGWRSGSVYGELETSFIPRLKGMKIPVEEKNMYEEIYNIVHKYTSEDDTILAFNNNQIFYDLTERKPYTQYVSLYHDVSPSNQPLEVLEQMKNELPKMIIFLRFSDKMEETNALFFRGLNKISGQKKLRDFITDLQKEEQYITVQMYKRIGSVDIDSIPNDLRPLLNKLNQPITVEEKNKVLNSLSSYIKIKNSFLETNTELYVLVRKDIYK